MATSAQLKSLIRAHFENDQERFATIALQIAAHEAKLGHATVAHDIRKYIDQARKRYGLLPGINIARDLNGMLLMTRPTERLPDLIVHESLRSQISRILDEYRKRKKLKQHGMSNRRRILLAGPPGTGKTMTASILAGELRLSLHTILMHKLVTKFMGETSVKLRQIFDVIQEEPGIFLFDEFDAIGTQRGREHEVGEMRRILNSFLQFIEQDASDSIIIAATNTFEVLDSALFRRFDDVLYYDLPDSKQRAELIANCLNKYISSSLDVPALADEAASLSHAEITRACEDAIKHVLLSPKKKVTKKLLLNMLSQRKEIYHRNRG